jgi:hypothetical protein
VENYYFSVVSMITVVPTEIRRGREKPTTTTTLFKLLCRI